MVVSRRSHIWMWALQDSLLDTDKKNGSNLKQTREHRPCL